MKQVYSALDEVDAQMAKGALDEARIESRVQAGALESILGEVTTSEEARPSLWVDDADVDRAAAALANFKFNAPPAATGAPSWKCPNCGEMIEPQFTACWHCGHSRPSLNQS
jgi:hypothetical protein